jgi:hypothetical protein
MLKKRLLAVAVIASLCAAPFAAEAKTKSSTSSTQSMATETKATEKASTKPIPFYGKVTSVDTAKKTFTIEGKKSTRTFTATATTKMGEGASWDAVKPGEYVRGSAMKKSTGQYDLVSLKIGQKEKTATSTKPETKTKKQ